VQCEQPYRPLFEDIAKNYATHSFINLHFAPALRELCKPGHIFSLDERRDLYSNFPSLFAVARDAQWPGVPPEMAEMLRYLSFRAQVILNADPVSAMRLLLCM
jgi:hypothetical protein